MELKNVEIIKIGKVQTFANDFRKLEFIVKDDSGQYPQELQLNILKDKVDDFIKYNKIGQRVDVSFNLNGRSWLKEGEPEENRRWFNSLDAWKVFKSEATSEGVQPSFEPAPKLNTKEIDDLPF
jgi:hypothetical protein